MSVFALIFHEQQRRIHAGCERHAVPNKKGDTTRHPLELKSPHRTLPIYGETLRKRFKGVNRKMDILVVLTGGMT
jgi:hypothetical protein